MRILREHGFTPGPLRKLSFDRVRSWVKDALWAVDFFAVKTATGSWLQVLIVRSMCTHASFWGCARTMALTPSLMPGL